MQRYLGPGFRGLLAGAGLGFISSSCSYGSAAAARGFYRKGADIRSVFSFLISSTNMNVAILVLFWSLLGWKFAFAEFFGGIIIIAIVTTGFTVIFSSDELARLRSLHPEPEAAGKQARTVSDCLICEMKGSSKNQMEHSGVVYQFCSSKHLSEFEQAPERFLTPSSDGDTPTDSEASGDGLGWGTLRQTATWHRIADTFWEDVNMLKVELLTGYLIAGFAAALIPPGWLSHALTAVGRVPGIGYVLLLATGILIAVATFVCSMGNVPLARYLAAAGIPLGANTSFIYGDLLVLPLISIYRRSFPAKVVWSFVGLFFVGAMVAGGLMELVIGGPMGGVSMTMGSMDMNDRFTLVSNIVALLALAGMMVAAHVGGRRTITALTR